MKSLETLKKFMESLDIERPSKEKIQEILSELQSELKKNKIKNQSRIKLLEDTFEAMKDGISILDKDFSIVKVNSWMRKTYPDEQLVGKKCYKVYQKRTSICNWCPSVKTIEEGEVHSSIVPYPSENNPKGWIKLTTFPIKNDQGEVIKIIEYVKDITKRRNAEIELEETKERLRTAMENTQLGLWDWNIKTGEVLFDELWAEMIGYDLDDLDSTLETWEKLVHPEDMPRVKSALNAHLQGKIPYYETEHRMKSKDGDWIWILDRGKVVDYDMEGNPLRATGTHQDITERKTAEIKLKQSEAKFRLLAEHSHVGILMLDTNYKFSYANNQLAKISGYPLDEIIGEDFRKFLDESSKKLVEKRYIKRQKGEELPPRYEFNILTKDGEKRRVENFASILKNPITKKT